jgi:hypothetical protein
MIKRPFRSYLDFYRRGPYAPRLAEHRPVGADGCRMLRVSQPGGDFPDPPQSEFMLYLAFKGCPMHFARRFRQATGMSSHAYVTGRRVAKARAALADGRHGLAQVALDCGFSSQAHLTTVFGQAVGLTPGRYRQLLM